MSIYGEGAYADASGAPIDAVSRPRERLGRGAWEVVDERGALLTPVPTRETKRPQLESVYALTKFDQESFMGARRELIAWGLTL
jgi:dTDP-L-rhamnose 4-epimerase